MNHAAVIINLDSTGNAPGPLPAWSNTGTLAGDFFSEGEEVPEVAVVDGVKGVQFLANPANAFGGTFYSGPIAPLTGGVSRTVEAWVWDPSAQDEKTVISWGHRGGPDGSNLSFGHGAHGTFGAVGHWGAPDIGWNNDIVFGRWNYIAYTYDEATRQVAVYADGALANSKILATALDTHATDLSASSIFFRLQRQTADTGAVDGTGIGRITVARVRVHDTALTAAEIQAKFDAEKITFGLADTDGDGLPDYYEGRYPFLNPNDPTDAAKDEDADGLTNLAEFQKQTQPDNADTDGDGLKDGVETGTGTWVSATATGTNPLNPDSDGDSLLDGVETKTGIFVSATNTGSDPTKSDSDLDSYDDGGEVRLGSNPNDASSLPPAGNWASAIAASAPKYWWRFEETDPSQPASNDGSAPGWDGQYGAGIVAGDLGKPSVLPGLGKAIEFTGPTAGNTTDKFVDLGANSDNPDGPFVGELTNFRPPTVDKTTTVEYWIRTNQRGSSGNQTWNSPAILGHESGGDGDMYWGFITDTGDFGLSTSDLTEVYSNRDANRTVTDGQWHHVVLVKEWHVNELCISTMYLDGGQAQGGATIVRTTEAGNVSYQDAADSGIRYLGFTEAGGSQDLQFIGMFDELLIYDRALTESEVRVHYRAVYEGDTDGDGMPDAFEISNGLDPNVNDAEQDLDNDGLLNIAEYQRGTLANNPDTDGDGLKDGVETGTGVWVSATNTGTDPKVADSDGDGLSDGVETHTGTFVSVNNTGTNPLKVDSDDDHFSDGDEIALGTSPVSASSSPPLAADWAAAVQASAPLYWWRFESTTAAGGVSNDGSVAGFDGVFGAGIADADLGKTSASTGLGKALEFTGPAAGVGTTKFVDFGAEIPELVNYRPVETATDGKTTTVEYWIKTTQTGSSASQTWNSPAIFAHESGGDGDMYWGWINASGQFAFSTSDIVEIFADGVTDGNWHHIVLVKIWNLNSPSVSRLYVDGGALSGGQSFETTTGPGTASLQDTDGFIQYLGYTQSGGSGNLQFIGSLDEVAIYNSAFNEAQARIHYLAAAVTPSAFAITAISRDPNDGSVTLTWESSAGTSYTIERVENLSTTPWPAAGQTTGAAGPTTTFKDTSVPANASYLFYRVRQN